MRRRPRDRVRPGKKKRRGNVINDYPIPDLSYREVNVSRIVEAAQSQNVGEDQTGAGSSVLDGEEGRRNGEGPHLSHDRAMGVHMSSRDDLSHCGYEMEQDNSPLLQCEDVRDNNNYLVSSSDDDERLYATEECHLLRSGEAEVLSPHLEGKNLDTSSGVVSSMLIAMGTERMNERWYETMRRFLGWRSESPENLMKLPSISKIKKVIRPLASRWLFPKSEVKMFEVDMMKAGANRGLESGALSGVKPVRIVKPSEWAKMDISSRVFCNLLHNSVTEHGSQRRFRSIEDTPLVRNRAAALSIFKWPSGELIRPGQNICVSCNRSEALKDKLLIHSISHRTVFSSIAFGLVVAKAVIHKLPPPMETFKTRAGKEKRKVTSRTLPFLIGDIVVEMETNQEEHVKVFVVFRSLKRPKVIDEFTMSLVFIEKGVSGNRCRKFKISSLKPVRSEGVAGEQSSTGRADASFTGKLDDGRDYIVYRMALYADDFNAHSTRKGSMGGVYMLPLGIPFESRRGAGNVRAIGLTPPGVSTNLVLDYIIDDIVEGSCQGFPCKRYDGADIVIFLDTVIFVGDYPAVSHTLDLLGHTANVPCHICTIERYDKSGLGGTKYGYTVDINSGHPSYARSMGRSLAVREAELSVEELRQLGMKPDKEHETKYSALIELGKELYSRRSDVPRTSTGAPVVPSIFDAYRSCVVSPDHLFLGLAQDAINAALITFPKEVRENVEILAKKLLRGQGLIYQNKLIDSGRRAVLSMTISSMYSFILVAPVSFSNAWKLYCAEKGLETHPDMREEKLLGLLHGLQRLISSTQFVPSAEMDGKEEFCWFNDQAGRSRIDELQCRAKEYVRGVDSYCRAYDHHKSPFDKPNLHRLLEFYSHSLPLLGDIRHFQELLFEGAHQPLKKAVAKSNNKNAQLQAMEHRLFDDWKVRLCVEIGSGGDNPQQWSDHILRGISQLLGLNPDEYEDFDTLRDEFAHMFPPPVMAEVRDLRHRKLCYNETNLNWETDSSQKLYSVWTSEMTSVIVKLKMYISLSFDLEHGRSSSGGADANISSLLSVNWTARGSSVGTGKPTVRYKLTCCDVVQAYTGYMNGEPYEDDCILTETWECSHDISSTSSRSFWFVYAILETEIGVPDSTHFNHESTMVLVVRECNVSGLADGLLELRSSSPLRVMKLTHRVQKVLVCHCCRIAESDSGLCHVDVDSGDVEHCATLEEGGRYYYFGRKEGYPPRSA